MYMLDVTGVLCVRSWQWPVYCSRAENILIIDLSKPCDTLCSCVCVCVAPLSSRWKETVNCDHVF